MQANDSGKCMRSRAFGIAALGAGLVLGMAALSARADTIAYYRFETGPNGAVATNIVDSSVNNASGTILFGAPTYNSNVPVTPITQTGQTDNFSMQFHTGDAASFAYPFPFQTLSNATLELYLKPNQTVGDESFIWTTTGAGDQNRFNIHRNPATNEACMDYREPGGTLHLLGCSGPGTVPANQWSYIAYVKQGNVYSIYVNGPGTGNVTALTSQVTDSLPNLPNSLGWTINGRGIQCSGACQFDGLLDEIRLSNKALSLSEFLVSSPPALPALQVTPADNIVAAAAQGGGTIFSPSSFAYQLGAVNGSVQVAISVSGFQPGIPAWLNPSFTSVTVTPGMPTTDTFSLINLGTLARGTYNATIAFTNTTNDQGDTTRTATLRIYNKDDCKNGGWQNFISPPGPFKNQGQCVSYFATLP